MAIVTLEGGWGESLLKHWVDANFQDLLTQDAAGSALLSAASITPVAGKAQTEFRAICNANMAYINTQYATSYTALDEGESWAAMRDKMNANFAAFDTSI